MRSVEYTTAYNGDTVRWVPCPGCRGKRLCDCDLCFGRGRIHHPRDVSHEIASLRARLSACEEAWKAIGTIIEESPELNMNNYNHDDVCELNAKMVEAVLFHRAALKEPARG